MRRLNVRFTQIEQCIRKSLFAVGALPASPPLVQGEELLLQLVKEDAVRMGKDKSRIEFALIFDHVIPDPTGELSRRHWPNAGKTWRYILHCFGNDSDDPVQPGVVGPEQVVRRAGRRRVHRACR